MIIGIAVLIAVFQGVAYAAVDCADPNAVGLYNSTPSDPTTIAYTTRTGADQVLFVGVGQRAGVSPRTHTQTHAGVALTAATAETYTDPIAGQLFYIISPQSGTNNVVIDWSTAPLAASAIIFTCNGVDLAGPIRFSTQSTGASSTTPSVTVSTQTGDIVVDFMVSESIASPTVGALQTGIKSGTAGAEISAGASYQAGSDGGVMTWTTNANDYSAHAVSIAPAVSTSAVIRRRQ